MSGPVFVGSVQLASRLVVDPEVADTLGAAGRPGASFTSSTVIATAIVSLSVPSDALTVTE